MGDFIRRNTRKSQDFAILKPFRRPRRSEAGESNNVEVVTKVRRRSKLKLQNRRRGRRPALLSLDTDYADVFT